MSRSFKRTVERTLEVEGVFSDHPDDSGGKTKYGITEKTAKDFGYEGKISELSVEEAKAIYKELYWDKQRLQEISELGEVVAKELFDTGVNCGVEASGKFLQRSLNLFNKSNGEKPLYDELKVDGIIGDKTIEAFKAFHSHRGLDGMYVLAKAINGLQVSFYFLIAEKDEKLESFTYGWIKNRT